MTVLVTGASGVLGHALVPRLLRRDEVRACVRRPDAAEPLRAMGAKVAVGSFDRADDLVEILPRVVTLIHLTGGPNQPDEDALFEANHRSTLTALAAAREMRTPPRFVLVSVPGASPDAADPFLRAKGLAEEAVATSGLDHVVIRCTHAYGIGGLWFTAVVQGALEEPPLAIGHEEVAPVWADDVAEVLAAAEDHASEPGQLGGTWALEGPDAVTPSDLTRTLRGPDGAEPVQLGPAEAGARLRALLGIPLAPFAVDHLLRPLRADAPDAAGAFGVSRTPLAEGLRRTAARVAPSAPTAAEVASTDG